MMPAPRRLALAGLVAGLVCVLIAVNERATRSPAALLEKGQMLHPYGGYPYYDGYDYNYYSGYPGYSGYPYHAYGNYPYNGYGAYDGYYDNYGAWQAAQANAQYQDQVNQAQYQDYLNQQEYADYVAQYNAYNAYMGQKAVGPKGDTLKVAKAPQLVYTGDLEFGGYRHDITGGNDGGYNAPFDINGDGQYVDNWAKVTTQWKHKKGQQQLKQGKAGAKQSQLKQVAKEAFERGMKMEEKRLAKHKTTALFTAPPTAWERAWNGHPGSVPTPSAPMKPWYWYLAYQKNGFVV